MDGLVLEILGGVRKELELAGMPLSMQAWAQLMRRLPPRNLRRVVKNSGLMVPVQRIDAKLDVRGRQPSSPSSRCP